MVGSIGRVKQGFGSRGYVTLAVQQQVTDLLAEFGAAWLKRSNNIEAARAHKLLEGIGLG